MADMGNYVMPAPTVMTPFHADACGRSIRIAAATSLGSAASAAWTANNKAYYYPFSLTDWAIAYQLLFWVGATSSGNIDVAIYDSQKNRIVSAGSTAMSATVNTVQELNITDTTLEPGDYLLAGACSTTGGTCFQGVPATDEITLASIPVYEQTTALALPDPGVPVLCTDASPPFWCIGIQLFPTF